jgi:hypothetical protein
MSSVEYDLDSCFVGGELDATMMRGMLWLMRF